MATPSSWILKAPRVVLILVFPTLSFLLYLILSLGCLNPSLASISPITVRSNSPISIGGSNVVVDLRVGFYGICFGPQTCLSSTPLNPRKEADLALSIPPSPSAPNLPSTRGNFALASLALSLQSSLLPASGLPLLLILIASLLANTIQIYFSVRGIPDLHAKTAVWARSTDWAAAGASLVGFVSYQGAVGGAKRLIRAVIMGGSGAGMLDVKVGGEAGRLFAGVVGLTVAGAVVNSWLTGEDVGNDAYVAWKNWSGTGDRTVREREREREREIGRGGGTGGGLGMQARMSRMFNGGGARGRAAYEVFP